MSGWTDDAISILRSRAVIYTPDGLSRNERGGETRWNEVCLKSQRAWRGRIKVVD